MNDYLHNLDNIIRATDIDFVKNILSSTKDRIFKKELKICVLGEFSSGKSTFINALLQNEVLATGDLPTTSVITYIQHSNHPNLNKNFINNNECLITYTDGHQKRLTIKNFLSNVKIDSDNPEPTLENRYIENIRFNLFFPFLANSDFNVIFIDTPGKNSTFEVHTAVADEGIDQSDIALILFDVSSGVVPKTLLRTVKAIYEKIPHLIFVLSKYDLTEKKEDELIDFLTNLLNDHSISHSRDDIFCISAKKYLTGIKEKNNQLIQQSNLEKLILYLKNLISNKEKINDLLIQKAFYKLNNLSFYWEFAKKRSIESEEHKLKSLESKLNHEYQDFQNKLEKFKTFLVQSEHLLKQDFDDIINRIQDTLIKDILNDYTENFYQIINKYRRNEKYSAFSIFTQRITADGFKEFLNEAKSFQQNKTNEMVSKIKILIDNETKALSNKYNELFQTELNKVVSISKKQLSFKYDFNLNIDFSEYSYQQINQISQNFEGLLGFFFGSKKIDVLDAAYHESYQGFQKSIITLFEQIHESYLPTFFGKLDNSIRSFVEQFREEEKKLYELQIQEIQKSYEKCKQNIKYLTEQIESLTKIKSKLIQIYNIKYDLNDVSYKQKIYEKKYKLNIPEEFIEYYKDDYEKFCFYAIIVIFITSDLSNLEKKDFSEELKIVKKYLNRYKNFSIDEFDKIFQYYINNYDEEDNNLDEIFDLERMSFYIIENKDELYEICENIVKSDNIIKLTEKIKLKTLYDILYQYHPLRSVKIKSEKLISRKIKFHKKIIYILIILLLLFILSYILIYSKNDKEDNKIFPSRNVNIKQLTSNNNHPNNTITVNNVPIHNSNKENIVFDYNNTYWYNIDDDIYTKRELYIEKYNDNFIEFYLSGLSGVRESGCYGKALIKSKNLAEFKQDNGIIIFDLKGDSIEIKTENTDEICGPKVSFDGIYTKNRELKKVTLTSLELANEKIDAAFKELAGEDYEAFLWRFQMIHYDVITIDGKDYTIIFGNVSGMAQERAILVYDETDTSLIAILNDEIYLTNIPQYKNKIPEELKQFTTIELTYQKE